MTTKTILVTALIAVLAVPAFAATKARSPNRAWDVYVGGVYVGSDPDPMIRHFLRREGPPSD